MSNNKDILSSSVPMRQEDFVEPHPEVAHVFVKDAISLMANLSVDSVASAVIDHFNVRSEFTSKEVSSVNGSAIAGLVFDGYLNGVSDKVQSTLNGALKFGILTEKDLEYFTLNPDVVVKHLSPLINRVAANNAV